jgi:hypothetical protein
MDKAGYLPFVIEIIRRRDGQKGSFTDFPNGLLQAGPAIGFGAFSAF